MLRIIVKHICGHFQFHLVDAHDDIQAAILEAELSRCECTNCQNGE